MDTPISPVPEDDPSDATPGPDSLPDFEEADGDDLTVDVHMEADGGESVGVLIAKGKDFGPKKADAHALAELIRTYAAALFEIALGKKGVNDWVAPPGIDQFRFASAHIRFVAGDNETIRMADPISPTVEASRQISDLMQAHDDELVQLARSVGPEGARAYRRLLKAIGDSEDAEVSWTSPGRQPVAVTSIGATKAFMALDREGESESDTFVVAGHLSMADADLHQFKLKLPKGAPRPPQLKGKRIVNGAYDDPVGQFVKEKGLWDRDVVAEIRIEREREETVAAPRNPKFHLLSVEPAVESPAKQGEQSTAPPGSMSLDDLEESD